MKIYDSEKKSLYIKICKEKQCFKYSDCGQKTSIYQLVVLSQFLYIFHIFIFHKFVIFLGFAPDKPCSIFVLWNELKSKKHGAMSQTKAYRVQNRFHSIHLKPLFTALHKST